MNRLYISSAFVMLAAGAFGSALAQEPLHTTELKDAQGNVVIVRSGQPTIPPNGPHPDFATLDIDHDGSISEAEAKAYPPLANDFKYVDTNHDGRISKDEYLRWK